MANPARKPAEDPQSQELSPGRDHLNLAPKEDRVFDKAGHEDSQAPGSHLSSITGGGEGDGIPRGQLQEAPRQDSHGFDQNTDQDNSGGASGKSKEQSGSELAQAEKSGASGGSSAVAGAEKGLFNAGAAAIAGSTPQGKIFNTAVKFFRSRAGKAGSGVGALVLVIVLFAFFAASNSILVFLTEQMAGAANKIENSAQANRRVNTFAKNLKDGTLDKKLNKEKFARKMLDRGFDVGYDPTTKKINKLDFEYRGSDGRVIERRSFNFNDNYKKASRDFFKNDAVGKKAFLQFQAATGGYAPTWSGKAFNRVKAKLKLRYSNWPDDPESKRYTGEKRLRFAIRKAQLSEDPYSRQNGVGGDGRDTDGDGTVSEEEKRANPDAGKIDDVVEGDQDKINEYRENLKNPDFDPENSPDARQAAEITDQLDNGGDPSEVLKEKNIISGSTAVGIARGLNVTEAGRLTCRAKGLLNYAKYIKSTAQAAAIAKFAGLNMVPGHQQSAGQLSSEGRKLVTNMLFKRDKKTGQTALQSGAVQSNIFGKKGAKISGKHLAENGVGRADTGVLAKISDILSKPPIGTVTGPTTCNVLNNVFVQIGGFAIGAVAAFFSGGGTTAVQIATTVAIGIVVTVVGYYAEQAFLKAQTGVVAPGNGEVGGPLGGGAGTLRTAGGGVNALRPMTKAQAAYAEQVADQMEELKLADQGVIERYFSMERANSLSGQLALALPSTSLSQSVTSSLQTSAQAFNPGSVMNSVSSLFGGNRVRAAGQECQDPEIKRHDLQADAFCNIVVGYYPDLDFNETERLLKANGHIDADGQPVSDEFKKYIEQCHSGRTDLAYKDASKVNPEEIKQGAFNPNEGDSTCIEGGSPLSGEVTYADDPSDNYAFEAAPKNPSWVAKLFGAQSVSAQPAPSGESTLVGKHERFTHWQGYIVDSENFVYEFNEEYKNPQGDPAADAAGSQAAGATFDEADLGKNSDNLSCAEGTKDLGVVTTKYTGELKKEDGPLKIRLCQVTDIPGFGNNKDGVQISGGATVDARVSGAWAALAKAAKEAGVPLDAGSSFRLADSCGGTGDGSACATPGNSPHQTGLAIDFGNGMYGTKGTSTTSCSGRARLPNNKSWKWLYENAEKYGIKQYTFEAWHWDATGFPNRCGKR